uniref:Uncharacterized protein n=1 Tax=Oryza nivara TaxID=4536 RepID=A0A0E0GF40_ORYNI
MILQESRNPRIHILRKYTASVHLDIGDLCILVLPGLDHRIISGTGGVLITAELFRLLHKTFTKPRKKEKDGCKKERDGGGHETGQ